MTLMDAILKKARSTEQLTALKQPSSPPPEIGSITTVHSNKKGKYKYAHVKAAVDSSPPALDARAAFTKLPQWTADCNRILDENRLLVKHIKRLHFTGGKVDSHWEVEPRRTQRFYYNRVDFWKRVDRENEHLYRRIVSARKTAKVEPCCCLEREWQYMRRVMVLLARMPFVLFPLEPRDVVEDPVFVAPVGVNRPRARLWLRVRGRCCLGWLDVELFTDQCPHTCQLFMELVAGDSGYSYIGTKFFRSVSNANTDINRSIRDALHSAFLH